MEIQMATATVLKPSVPKQLPPPFQEEAAMKWATPRIDIAVGLQINAYACAESN
jgi:hypothetical protein